MDSLRVTTGSRLHFGPMSWKSDGPNFGGLGLMIDQPETIVEVHRSDSFAVEGESQAAERIERMFTAWQSTFSCRARFRVIAAAPSHKGFGSGTQLLCAATAGLLQIAGLPVSHESLAAGSRRGERSAIGLHGFLSGGFLVDAGRFPGASPGALVSRLAFPDQWTVLLDRGCGTGVSGQSEHQAFQNLAPMPQETTNRLCNLALRAIAGGIAAGRFDAFAEGLTEYGCIAGQFFQAAQGGVFADSTWSDRCKSIQKVARCAVAQSSWGPTVAVITESRSDAEAIVAAYPDRVWQWVSSRNEPACIEAAATR